MSVNIPSEHDLELLSAYLDGELNDRDRQHVEQRLIEEAALRSALDDLRATVSLLQSLPRLKAPRDFTLDPALYHSPRINFYRLMQFSGALGTLAATLLIAFAIFLDWESGTTQKQDTTSQSSSAVAIVPSLTPLAQAFTFEATLEAEGEVSAAMPDAQGTPTVLYMQASPSAPATLIAQAEEPAFQPPAAAGAAESSAYSASPQPQPLEADGAAAYDTVAFPTATATVTPTTTRTSAPPPTPTLAGTSTAAREHESDEQTAENMALPTEQPSMKATAVLVAPTSAQPPPVPAPPAASSPAPEDESGKVWVAQLGLILLLVSLSAFVWGYWKARH